MIPRRSSAALLAFLVVLLATAGCGETPSQTVVSGPAPDSFRVVFETSRGRFVALVHRAWAPHGADRFHELAASGFFDEQRFFRVLPGYIAQFGASGDPEINERWKGRTIPDDSAGRSNARGTISFAHDGPGKRSHQLFINLKDNPRLDPQGFVPIGSVVEGMSVADSIYDDYGETPRYHLVATLGNSYLRRMFPKLDYIRTARVVPAAEPTPAQ